MGNNVFANGREVSCKAADGKAICAFPDVCFTPPECPATPPGVPVPYPNTGLAKDTTSGSKSVKVSKKEVMLKNKSYFKKSYGDEAGCAAKKGVLTSTNRGKVYFNSWSMDVKFEGQNIVRHLDLTTHNHMSMPGNTPTWPYLDTMSMSDPGHPCVDDQIKEMQACEGYQPHGDEDPCPPSNKPTAPDFSDCAGDLSSDDIQNLSANVSTPSLRKKKDTSMSADAIKSLKNKYKNSKTYKDFLSDKDKYFQDLSKQTSSHECLQARRCMLVPYEPASGQTGCCPDQTPHHLVEASSFFDTGRGGSGSNAIAGCEQYDANKAPCICVEGESQFMATHGLIHTFQGNMSSKNSKNGKQTFGQAKDAGAKAVGEVFPESGCNEECLKSQVGNYHKDKGIDDEKEILAKAPGRTKDSDVAAAKQQLNSFKQDISSRCEAVPGNGPR